MRAVFEFIGFMIVLLCLFVFCLTGCQDNKSTNKISTTIATSAGTMCVVTIGTHQYLTISGSASGLCHYEDCDNQIHKK